MFISNVAIGRLLLRLIANATITKKYSTDKKKVRVPDILRYIPLFPGATDTNLWLAYPVVSLNQRWLVRLVTKSL